MHDTSEHEDLVSSDHATTLIVSREIASILRDARLLLSPCLKLYSGDTSVERRMVEEMLWGVSVRMSKRKILLELS